MNVIESPVIVALETPGDPGTPLLIRVAIATDVPPCPSCGGTKEAVLVLVGSDGRGHDGETEYTTLIYPCGHTLGRSQCHLERGKK